MGNRLKDKIALVTGAGSGLGRAAALHLAREGARVAGTDIDKAAAEATAREIAEEIGGETGNDRAIAIDHDVADPGAWAAAMEATQKTFGGLHILINNAGISRHGDMESTTYEDFQLLMDIDLNSVFLGCQAAIPVMRESGGGSIVNISSVAGIMGNPNTVAYGTAKAGVRYLTKCVALDCAQKGYGIRCNSVHPTYIRTPLIEQFLHEDGALDRLNRMIPLGRICETEDVTHPIVFLASDESAMMTGAEVVIDGGLSCGYSPRV